MKNLKISTSEIAKICNVSQGTVDRALNNRPDIKAETKQKILEVARRFGYRAPVEVTPCKIKGQVGVVVFNLNNEYFSELITELEFALRQQGFCTTVMMSHYDTEQEIACIKSLYNMGVEGIVLCAVNNSVEFRNFLKLFDIPIVTVGNKIEGLPYVGVDDFAAMRDMTNRVLSEHYEQLVYFSPALNYPNAHAQRLRYEGFLSAVGGQRYSVVTDTEEIPENYPEKTAILCSNDYYAMQAYFKTKNATVFGFDNIKALQKYRLSIDSVGYSMTEIAQGVTETLKNNTKLNILVSHFIAKNNTR